MCHGIARATIKWDDRLDGSSVGGANCEWYFFAVPDKATGFNVTARRSLSRCVYNDVKLGTHATIDEAKSAAESWLHQQEGTT